jgi:osmotically-inducible protein OsmY
MFFVSCDNVEHAAQSAAKKPIPAIMVALELERTIRAKKFANDEILKRAELDVMVQADKNEATLSGTVSSAQVRDQAIQLARSAQSGLTVNDKIAVRPPA